MPVQLSLAEELPETAGGNFHEGNCDRQAVHFYRHASPTNLKCIVQFYDYFTILQ